MENLLVFDSTHQAMQMEEAVKKSKIEKARLIPTPESITASCGLSLKFKEENLTQIEELATDLSFKKIQFYQIVIVEKKKSYVALSSKG